MNKRNAVLVALSLVLSACGGESDVALPGTVEWDRVAVLAETAEPVREVRVHEGDRVNAGDVLLELDGRRTGAELAAAQAERESARARLAALRHGARSETIDAARGDADRARAEADNAQRARDRLAALHAQGLVARADLDRATANADAAAGAVRAAEARLRELQRGSRREDVDAAASQLAALDARVQVLAVTRERLTVVAPRAGVVDALPFRAGDQPVVGATLASLLAGDAPYVRVYVPATQRASLAPGARFKVQVEGVDAPFDATLRSIRSEAAFTPYYALVGDDAARLVYRAELVLAGDAAKRLPAGLPAVARAAGAAP